MYSGFLEVGNLIKRCWLTLDFKLDVHGDISKVAVKRTAKIKKIIIKEKK